MKTTISFEILENYLSQLENDYKDYISENASEYVLEMFQKDGNSITVYKSKKVVIQGLKAEEIAYKYGYIPKTWDLTYTHIGSDEVGTGDFFGPIIVASAYVKETDVNYLIEIGANDSKKLTDKFILDKVPSLLKRIPHTIAMLDNHTYNKYIAENYNMNKMKALLHNQCLESLSNKTKCDKFVIDQFCSEEKFYEYIESKKVPEKSILFTTKGESRSPAVAVASMFARYTFLVKIKELNNKYNVNIPLGANKEVESYAKQLQDARGIELLTNIGKLNFKTIK